MKGFFAFCAALVLCVSPLQFASAQDEVDAAAEEPAGPWLYNLGFGVFNHYMYRGQKLYDGPSLNPQGSLDYDTGFGQIGTNFWMHLSGDTDDTASRFSEYDIGLRYTHTIDGLTFGFGNTWYNYSDFGDGTPIEDTKESYLTFSYDTLLYPTITWFHDWDLETHYLELSFSHEVEVDEHSSLEPYVAFGFIADEGEEIYDDTGLGQVTIGSNLNLTAGPIAVVPSLNYSFKVDDTTVNQLWFGITFSWGNS